MKRKLLCLALAASMAISSIGTVSAFAADSEWQSGWTGKEGSKNFTVTADGNTVVMENTKANNGKFSNDEDSIIYYASEVSADTDFTLSAKVNIDAYGHLEESSNSQQGSVGIGVLDSLYHKTDELSYDDGIYLGSYGKKKDADMAITALYRADSDKKTVGNALSDSFAPKGENLGAFDLSITKAGNTYTLTCGEKSQTIEVTALEDEIYPCLYIARNAKATFSDVKLEIAAKKAVSLELKGNVKTSYLYGEKFDTKGLKGVITYDDGSTEETDSFLIKDFNSKKVGKQTVSIVSGGAAAKVEAEVAYIEATAINVDYLPLKTRYAANDIFRTEGLQVSAEYSNGTKKVLEPEEYNISIDGKALKAGTKLSAAGRKNVEIKLNKSEGISSTKVAAFPIEISSNKVTSVEVKVPVKTVYYLGDKLDTSGMEATVKFKTSQGQEITEVLKNNEYTVSGYDSESAGEKNVFVSPVSNPDCKAQFKVTVKERQPEGITLTKYPRTTYAVGESFDSTDMAIAVKYDNGDLEPVEYTVNVDKFDSSEAGQTSVTIGADGYNSVELPITVVENMDNKWRKATFGQSSGHDKPESANVTAENYGTVEGKINVKAWDGAGKITNDHDGMTYYFTSIKGNNDFKLSADVTVNKYLEHDNDDTKRNGQEAFGIMVRDAVPLSDADGNTVVSEASAKKDEDGVCVPVSNSKVFASNMAIFGGYSGTGWPNDESSLSYEKNTKINRINLLVREGVTAPDGGGTRVGPYALSSDFPKEGNKYRLTLERLNGALYAKCYNYQTEETLEKYYYDESFLTTQNPDNAYVGFFAARWADIDVENVSFYETNKATDQTVENSEKQAQTPAMYFRDKTYSTSTEYKFKLDVDDSYGRVTVKMNNTVIAQDMPIENIEEFSAKLNPNSINKLIAVYTPSDALNLTSYEPIVIKENIYHKDAVEGAEVYASPEGNFDGKGTADSPVDIDTAIGIVEAGQSVILKEGIYKRTKPVEIVLGDDGRADAYKTIKAEEGKKVILDGNKESALIVHAGNYWKYENIEFVNSGDNLKCFHLGGSNNIVKNCVFHDNGDLGLQISRISGLQTKELWPANNLIENCESYNNCDPSMINADGFGAKLTVGEGNRFVGCKSHHNVDDGWDLYTKVNSGAIGVVTLENCQAYKMGMKLNPDGTETPYNAGGNNGFKLGGENVGVQHVLINCEAYENGNNGFTTNSNPMLKLVNCKSHDNGGANIRLYSDKPSDYDYDVQGVTSTNGGEPDVVGTVTRDKEFKNASSTPLVSEINKWFE